MGAETRPMASAAASGLPVKKAIVKEMWMKHNPDTFLSLYLVNSMLAVRFFGSRSSLCWGFRQIACLVRSCRPELTILRLQPSFSLRLWLRPCGSIGVTEDGRQKTFNLTHSSIHLFANFA